MKRASGVLLHISSVWGEYSCGSFGKACREWIDFLKESGFTYWQVLPFCVPDEFNSPYKSFSAFSLNPYFIDLEELHSLNLITDNELEKAKQSTGYYCEFDRLAEERFSLLSKASERFKNKAGLNKFLDEHPCTENFCKFMALREANNGIDWQKWQRFDYNENTLNTWRFTQYIFYTQWLKVKEYANKNGIKIIGDIPIYVSADSSDVRSAPENFQLNSDYYPDKVAGVPPDYFAQDGQLWGNPLYDWKSMEKDGYSWWTMRLEFMNELFDGVRIDHFRGLESYYSIKSTETTARNGKWVKGPGLKFIKKIKEVCDGKLIIAEDLGDITPAVQKLVKKSGFPGMRVLQFAFAGDKSSPHLPHNYIENCVAYTGTHDNNTLLGYIWELDDKTRKEVLDYCGFTGDDWDKSYDSILRTMFASHAGLLILPVQDLLKYGSDTRLNRPGLCTGNWSYRITKEQLEAIKTEDLFKINKLYGR